jgi:hypothetical protein
MHFCLSNSEISAILNSLQCKQFMSTNSITEHEPMQQQQQQHITFNMPQQPNMHANSNNNSGNNNNSGSHSSIHNFSVINNHVNPNSSHAIFNMNPSAQQAHTTQPHPLSSTTTSTFKRHDTIEWNENDTVRLFQQFPNLVFSQVVVTRSLFRYSLAIFH